MKRLFIAEKRTVAEALAGELGAPAFFKSGYYKVGDDYVAWQAGHILRAKHPGEYTQDWATWDLAQLPMLPNKWENVVSEKCSNLLKTIKDLSQKVDILIHVGDPDREGQLLVDEVLEFIGNKKPVMRLLMPALDSTTIQRALKTMESNEIYKNKSISALARQRTDWLYGMNCSRKFTLELRKQGFSGTVSVGRVQTPTINLVIKRNELLANFKSIQHFGLRGYFTPASNIAFTADWKPENVPVDDNGKITDVLVIRAKEQELLASKQAIVTKLSKTIEISGPPEPFNTSALQIAAGKLYQLSPKEVLDTAQKLYEKKLTTYGRSDCIYLPTAILNYTNQIADNMKITGSKELLEMAQEADFSIVSSMFNDDELDVHHAISPTTIKVDLETLDEKERMIYSLIAKNFLSLFFPPRETEKIYVELQVGNDIFTRSTSKVIKAGWSKFYKHEQEHDDDIKQEQDESTHTKLANLQENDILEFWKLDTTKTKTTPPKQYTQFTLLAAMSKIHQAVQSKELKNILKETKGIGTEATRANIIAKLLVKDRLSSQVRQFV